MCVYMYIIYIYRERERAQWTSIPPKIFLQDISPSVWMAGHFFGAKVASLAAGPESNKKEPIFGPEVTQFFCVNYSNFQL